MPDRKKAKLPVPVSGMVAVVLCPVREFQILRGRVSGRKSREAECDDLMSFVSPEPQLCYIMYV